MTDRLPTVASRTLLSGTDAAAPVERADLVRRLRAASGAQLVTITAPPGYGKTALLAQWDEADDRLFAWVTVDQSHNSVGPLVAHISAALSRGLKVHRTNARNAPATGESVITMLSMAVASMPEPFVLVLDDAHLLVDPECFEALNRLVGCVPDGSQIVLSGREQLPLSEGRLQLAGKLLTLELADLALDAEESERLLRDAGVLLPPAEVADVVVRAEGWPAALRLTANALQGRRRLSAVTGAGAGERRVGDYIRDEHLSNQSEERLLFLTHTSVLDRLTPALCDALLQTPGADRALRALAAENPFLLPLKDGRDGYRYHRMYRELLRDELDLREPGLANVLNLRASAQCRLDGDSEEAVAYAHRAGDLTFASSVVARDVLSHFGAGRADLVDTWLEPFDDAALLRRHPAIGVQGAWVHGQRGRAEIAARWASTVRAEWAETAAVEPCLQIVRAALCEQGVDQMLWDAERALEGLSPFSEWRPAALVMAGVATLLSGDQDEADAIFAAAADCAAAGGALDLHVLALAERALVALDRREHPPVRALVSEATNVLAGGELDDYPTTTLLLAVRARTALRDGMPAEARADLHRAAELRPRLTHALPWLAVQARLQLALAHLGLADAVEARKLLLEIHDILHRRPHLTELRVAADELSAQVSALAGMAAGGWVSTLTPAELRLLPLLATHLSFREIGERLFISRNTVKTEAISIYRKLGVTSRTDALARATDLGLIQETLPASASQAALSQL
jgi:LuxR family transcriptional regulator, maltose regulon positive regulatory protein